MAIVRVSGPGAIGIAGRVFAPTAGGLCDCLGFRHLPGLVRLTDGGLACELPATAYVFRAPRSYTRQDLCELHIPGPAAAATWLFQAMLSAGARAAQPGEFTARAFFSGRIDLSAAEGVADIIDAASASHYRSGLAALGGAVHGFCQGATEELADALASVEASIDLADEAIEFDSPGEMAGRLSALAGRVDAFAQRAADLPDQARQATVVLAGRPNAGKSSLLNALAGSDRAIVSTVAGTTRDVISATIELDGNLVLVQDLAGLENANDSLSLAGQGAAQRAIASADAIVFLIDLAADDLPSQVDLLEQVRQMNAGCPMIVLGNKADLVRENGDGPYFQTAKIGSVPIFPVPICHVSALTGLGLDEFRRELATRLNLDVARAGEALGLHLRQKRCLLGAADAARRAAELLSAAATVADIAELAAIELRLALAEVGQISGQVVTEDILGRIFRRFCVGK